MTPREAAFLAVLAFLKKGDFVFRSLENWYQSDQPSALDISFAYEIASGSVKRALSLDYIATQLSKRKKLSLKPIERALLRTALYQACFMQKVPLYAIVNETINLAKKYSHPITSKFFNALLRKLEFHIPSLPNETSSDSGGCKIPQPRKIDTLSIQFSYPTCFIEDLITDYRWEEAVAILTTGNRSPTTMVRLRDLNLNSLTSQLDLIKANGMPMARVNDSRVLKDLIHSKHYYVQNITPVSLVEELAKHTRITPTRILDLCASPGGKLLAAHDLFPQAELYANDVSKEKVARLEENLRKYGIQAHLSISLGESYISEKTFDLIILDLPCSNSGVLSKRPEARWRLDSAALSQLRCIQKKLLRQAAKLLTAQGEIWYLTCSILKDENERFIAEEASKLALEPIFMQTILPNEQGYDGGFGCLLRRTILAVSSSRIVEETQRE